MSYACNDVYIRLIFDAIQNTVWVLYTASLHKCFVCFEMMSIFKAEATRGTLSQEWNNYYCHHL